MKSTRRSAYREGAFAETEDRDDLNPWLLILRHMDPLSHEQGKLGFTLHEVRHANRFLNPERGVGETFLAQTRLHPYHPEWDASTLEYFSSALGPVLARSGSETPDARATVRLPDPAPLELSLQAVLERRRSTRAFSGDPIEPLDVSTVLHSAAGITHQGLGVAIDRPMQYRLRYRTVPSAGGLYAVDCYCFVFTGRGIAPGVYRYLPFEHALAQVGGSDQQALREAFIQSDVAGVDIDKVAAALCLVGNPGKLYRKYGDRGVRYLFLEAGMMSFAANLTAHALGWGVVDYQSFYEPRVESCIGLRNRQHYVLHALLLGWPAEEATL
jgi:SagB-type dehydrogenase family enzyme